ncbi:S9 family peptidase [Dongia sedimenti]|uniref:Prolyl oligopeptidase family serine peptidase n=1 Tax=Dongia sedimenti TaxID=3064282 RepID=A0ABU0YLQ6_9PROT|nr:prolyl oligopeptidase family serine peptidase [Rhodospirillaceae bacterium R-7]
MSIDLSQHDAFLDRLLKVPQLYGAKISPDGNFVAWIWAGLAETTQLWVTASTGLEQPRLLVGDDWDCDSFRWAPDSRSIVYARSKDGDERVGLHQVFLDGRAPVALTEDRPDYYIHGGALAKDGRSLLFSANVDENGAEIEPTWVYVQDGPKGGRRVLARPQRAHYGWPLLSPDDRHVLYDRNDPDPAGSQLWLTDLAGSFDREIVNVGPDKKADGSWTPDGKSVLVVAETATHRKIGLWRLARGAVQWLIDDPTRNIANADWPRRAAEIVVDETQDARPRSYLLNPATGTLRLFGPFTDGTLAPVGVLAEGAWLAWHYSARVPARLVRVALEASGPRILGAISTHPSAHIPAPDELVAAEDFRWTSEDSLPIQGWLYRARGDVIGTILDIHGGPTAHDEDAFGIDPQYFAHCGFNVLQVNYRGSTGFSFEFQESIKQQGWGGAEQIDIRTGAEALIRAGIAQAGKVGITGTSYGGYSSWWAITHFSPQIIAAAAPICGMTDLVVDYETTRPDIRPYSEEMMGGSPSAVPERYRERSPIHFIENIRGRLLIVQGANDPNVTPQNVADVRKRLDAAGKPYEVLVFDDEGHGIGRPANRRVLLKRLAQFFAGAFA